MNRFLIFCVLGTLALSLKAQTPAKPALTEEYGKVSKEDLELKTCDFEKDANAEVLFDKATQSYDQGIYIERHVRIKIFNDFGKSYGSAEISYGTTVEPDLKNVDGETINLVNGLPEITKLDKKLIYIEKTDKQHVTLKFALPNVKAGSVIEFKYKWYIGTYATWYFQSTLPTRYSEIDVVMVKSSSAGNVRVVPHVTQPFVKEAGNPDDVKQTRALANIHSLGDEPFMASRPEALERMEFLLLVSQLGSWKAIGETLVKADDFGAEFSHSIKDESAIIKQAKALKTNDEKIAFIFDTVRNSMKWNDHMSFFTTDGIATAWNKKAGNSAEINLILYRLLKKSGVEAYPLITNDRAAPRMNPANPLTWYFSNTLVYIPVDTAKSYVLDATNKYNLYNTIPSNYLNTFGFKLDEANQEYKTVFLENAAPVLQSVFFNVEIKSTGQMEGTAEIANEAYNKTNVLNRYKSDGEEKYINSLRNGDNGMKIKSLKLEGANDDNLPLTQKIEFSFGLPGDEVSLIYFNSNLFAFGKNPFTNEERFSDINFGYRDNYSINGVYKLPAGFKAETLPKNMTIIMPDQSITFKRQITEDNGTLTIRYVLNHKKTMYFRADYDKLRAFYKQLYDMLNEQIVLKKA